MQIASIRYQDLFKFRSVWMGFAILWVVLFHSSINLSWLVDWKTFGYGGVDIFFFASGLGCYYSLQKQPDPSLFLCKRINRIVPPYFLVLVLWLALELFLFHTSMCPLEVLSNFLCTGTFCGAENQFNWYVSGVWPSYLLAPFLVAFLDRASRLKRLIPLVFLFLFSLTFLSSSWNLMSFASRLPIFYIGMLFAKSAQEQDTIKTRTIVCWIGLFLAGALLLKLCYNYAPASLTDFGMWWYPFILITPGLCLAISLLCLLIQRVCHWPVALFQSIGNCSFELYLTHLTAFSVITYCTTKGIFYPNNTFWCFIILICCLLAFLLRKFIGSLSSHLVKHTTHSKSV